MSKYLLYHWNEEAEEFEGDIVTYCPSQEEWKQLFQWEEEGDYRYQTAKQIEQQGEQLKQDKIDVSNENVP